MNVYYSTGNHLIRQEKIRAVLTRLNKLADDRIWEPCTRLEAGCLVLAKSRLCDVDFYIIAPC
jgi:hypothetical protein